MKLKNILNVRNWRAKYWFLMDMEEKKLDYDLNEDSLVFDIGGYKGNNTIKLWMMYECNIYTFEPIKEFYKEIKSRVPKNKKIKLHNFGLADKIKKQTFFLKDVGSSQYVVKDKDYSEFKEQICKLKDIEEFLGEKKIDYIDLMIVDIEGSEYELLIKLIKSGYIKIIENIMIQFHRTVPDYRKKRKKIRQLLKNSHNCKLNMPFLYEKWERK